MGSNTTADPCSAKDAILRDFDRSYFGRIDAVEQLSDSSRLCALEFGVDLSPSTGTLFVSMAELVGYARELWNEDGRYLQRRVQCLFRQDALFGKEYFLDLVESCPCPAGAAGERCFCEAELPELSALYLELVAGVSGAPNAGDPLCTEVYFGQAIPRAIGKMYAAPVTIAIDRGNADIPPDGPPAFDFSDDPMNLGMDSAAEEPAGETTIDFTDDPCALELLECREKGQPPGNPPPQR